MLTNLEDVILFASEAHKDQKMFEPEVPYVTHIVSVAENVLEAYLNGDEKFDLDYALKLALLHDTMEDTSVTYDILLAKYGKDIADGVRALSKDETLPKDEQMQHSLDNIKKCRKEVGIVKLADRTFNMYSKPKCWDENKYAFYLWEAKLILDNLKGYNKYLENKLSQRIENY